MNQDERRAPVPRTVTGKIDDSVNGKQESEADPAIEGLIEAEDQEQPRGETLSLIMSLYFGPLLAYARRIARREPIELVCDFFAERVARAEYLRSWRSSGLRLRSWLMNGLWFYAREVRSSRRATLGLAAAADVPALALDPGRAMEEAFARRLVQRALDIAGAQCSADGLTVHWSLFHQHFVHKRSYPALAVEHGLTTAQAGSMARAAIPRFKKALELLLEEDGASPLNLQEELLTLLESLRGTP